MGLLAGVIVGIITLFIIYAWSQKRKSRRSIVLTGTCESGKTAIFGQLVHGRDISSYTSIKENEGIYSPPGKQAVRMIDIPGHERVRQSYIDKLKSSTRGIVYVVDASDLSKQLRDATEFLFNILSDPEINSARIPVIVACNKQVINIHTISCQVT